MKRTYSVVIEQSEGRVEVSAVNEEGAPFAGHADSTGTIPLSSLLTFLANDILREYAGRKEPRS